VNSRITDLNTDEFRQVNSVVLQEDNIVFPAFPVAASVQGRRNNSSSTSGPLSSAIVAVISNIGEDYCNATVSYQPTESERSRIDTELGKHLMHPISLTREHLNQPSLSLSLSLSLVWSGLTCVSCV